MTEELTKSDYEEVLADTRRLTRELDVALHGKRGAAAQASLCDLIKPAKLARATLQAARTIVDAYITQNTRSKSRKECGEEVLEKIDFALGDIPFQSSTVVADLHGSRLYEEVLRFRWCFHHMIERFFVLGTHKIVLWLDHDTGRDFTRTEEFYLARQGIGEGGWGPNWMGLTIGIRRYQRPHNLYETDAAVDMKMMVERQPLLMTIEYVVNGRVKYFDHPETDEVWR